MTDTWQVKLDKVVHELKDSPGAQEYDLRRIFRLVGAPTVEDLAMELTERIQRGQLAAVYRILSPQTKSGIAEFRRFSDIPEEIYDENVDETIHVQPFRDMEIIYRAA
jgi:hypothetical protein